VTKLLCRAAVGFQTGITGAAPDIPRCLLANTLMSGDFYKVGFFNWNAKGNKKSKKGKRGKKGGFLALFAFFAFLFPLLLRRGDRF
jgi:hypothetical protein